jgi:hypothetical protein
MDFFDDLQQTISECFSNKIPLETVEDIFDEILELIDDL